MRVKLDENIPASLLVDLAALGHNVDSVPSEGVAGYSDVDVFEAAQRTKRFLVTQDLDFSDVRRFAPGTHEGLLLVRLSRPGRLAIRQRIKSLFETEDITAWSRCFVVATERKIRIRRP